MLQIVTVRVNFWLDTCLHMPGCTEKQPHELNMTFMGEANQKKKILNIYTVIIMNGIDVCGLKMFPANKCVLNSKNRDEG